jgi:pyridoxal phosphate enzyme (YggS family)
VEPAPALPGVDPADAAALAIARARVMDRIERACDTVRRDPAEVSLVAVSKTVPVKRLRAAVAGGINVFGENRVQEAVEKAPDVTGSHWVLVGPLQSNKARAAAEVFESVQTVGTLDLARRLDRVAAELRSKPWPVLLQVNVDADPGKAGFTVSGLERALPELLELPHLALDGLMTIGRLVETPAAARPTFRRLRELSDRLRASQPRLGGALSMGMSDDFDIAIEEGATVVRVGRAIFGERPAA